ncbi:MAG TPA: class I SAM-dependent methyltransferase [Blastocatellia bacterium]|jgi:ubiquinone/menaquinone biosynthesis C-methylase UbiE|nr:class I SAM-dependent methyltransferase [Blastocatellia bacterium]
MSQGKLQPGAAQSIPERDAKRAARKQWGENPCGAHVASGLEFGTLEFFEAIERYRYQVYAPWMKEIIGFDRYRGKRLLEVGCGTGTDLLQFARGGALVTGLDLTPRSLEIARRRFDLYGMAGEFANGDAENLSFPDETFDVVYSFGVIHHTPDTERAACEIHRVLRKGGQAIVMLYNRSSLYYWAGLMLKRGLFRAELLRDSPAGIMSRYVEHSETGGRPLVKAYTREEAFRLFRHFSRCEVHVNQLTRAELGPGGRLLPEEAFRKLARTFGWNLIIKATK